MTHLKVRNQLAIITTVANYSSEVPVILVRYNKQHDSVMSINYRRHVISEFVRLHFMKAYRVVEVMLHSFLTSRSLHLWRMCSLPPLNIRLGGFQGCSRC